MRRRELLFGAFGSILYVACGSDDDGNAAPTTDGGPNGGDGGPNGDGGQPLSPTSPADTSHRVFPQGVASGDPRPDRVVLWTRVEPTEAGKTEADDIDLELVIAKDEALTDIVAREPVKAEAKWDHAVKVVPTELEPGRFYYYRFEVAGSGNTTQVGRTKTAPAADADVPVKYVMAACQDYIGRYWHAWKAFLDEKLEIDFVMYLGDYIYESVNDERFQSSSTDRSIKLPDGIDTSPKQDKSRIAASTLADYRTLYKTYRKDPLLREVHRLHPFIVTWDDHEFADDCWQDHSTSFNGKDPTTGGPLADDEKNTPRRTNANRAFWEHQPIDVVYKSTLFFPADISIYRSLRYGKHVEIFMTDQRQYRADHLIPEGQGADISVGKFIDYTIIGTRYFVRKAGFDPKEASAKPSLLGAAQKAWFVDAVKKSTATWKVWGNEVQVYQMGLDLKLLPGVPDDLCPGSCTVEPYVAYVNCDQWDGFRSERQEILTAFKDANVKNLLVCTGDIHSFYAAELHTDFDAVKAAPTTTPVGVEYVTAGISSASLRALFEKFIEPDSPFRFIVDAWTSSADSVLKTTNDPWLKYADTDSYGFCIMTVDGTKAQAEFVQTSDPRVATSGGVVARNKFVTQVGTNKVTPV